MHNVPVSLVSYKQTKEDIKEIVKDLKTTGRWVTKTSKKLKKFNERDIFEEHDSAIKQLKELNDKVNAIITVLAEAIKRVGQRTEDIDVLYKAVLMLLKRMQYLDENKADKISPLASALAENILRHSRT